MGDALGSFVTRLKGRDGVEADIMEEHAIIKVIDKRQTVKWIALFNLITAVIHRPEGLEENKPVLREPSGRSE